MDEIAKKAIDELRQQSEAVCNSEMPLDDINEEIRQARCERKKGVNTIAQFVESCPASPQMTDEEIVEEVNAVRFGE